MLSLVLFFKWRMLTIYVDLVNWIASFEMSHRYSALVAKDLNGNSVHVVLNIPYWILEVTPKL